MPDGMLEYNRMPDWTSEFMPDILSQYMSDRLPLGADHPEKTMLFQASNTVTYQPKLLKKSRIGVQP